MKARARPADAGAESLVLIFVGGFLTTAVKQQTKKELQEGISIIKSMIQSKSCAYSWVLSQLY